MSETSFSLNDLVRRKLQTFLTIFSLALSAGSTLFLLLSAERVGFGISLRIEGKLTAGVSNILSPFILFLTIVIVVTGAVIVAFMTSLMMSQRKRDIGLMKAAGCPNEMIFGYFFTELLVVAFVGCLIGVIFGLLADFASAIVFGGFGSQLSEFHVDFWPIVLVFGVFLGLSLVAGAKPIFDVSRITPAEAISPSFCVGLSKESSSKVLSRSGFTLKLAVRGLVRHRSATIRAVLCLTTIFTLVTVAIAGGLVAERTSIQWVERAMGRNVVLVAHQDVCGKYRQLLEAFSGGNSSLQFNYTSETYRLDEDTINRLRSLPGVSGIDERLMMSTFAEEVQGLVLGDTSDQSQTVGDDCRQDTLIIGVQPNQVLSNWLLRGIFLNSDQTLEAVVGDTLSTKMFSDALLEKIRVFNKILDIVGVCVDPINNGNVAYVPIKTLENLTGASETNFALVRIDPTVNRARAQILNEISTIVHAQDSNLTLLDIEDEVNENLDFLEYVWSPILILPLLSLIGASLCLVSFVVLSIDEQRQEFGILRAVGAQPRTVVGVVSAQSMFVLLSSFSMGVGFGTIATSLILMQNPVITPYTVLEIGGLLALALVATFLSTLYPVFKFAHKPLLEAMRQR
jgi:ABC-type antimicrobial peptide transport system permease subunit